MENQQAVLEVGACGMNTGTCREGRYSELAGQEHYFEATKRNDNWQRLKIQNNDIRVVD